MNSTELNQLIDALIEGDISEADFIRLEAEMSVDPTARQAYYERQTLTMALSMEATARQSIANPKSTGMKPRRWMPQMMAIAAVLALSGIILSVLWRSGTTTPIVSAPLKMEEVRASGHAVLVGQSEAIWDENNPLIEGALIPSGRIRLNSGAAQLELFSGVSVVLEGAAEFELISSMEMTVHRGKIRARVPEPAHGFRIHTPEGEVVDLGTEFGLEVSAAGSEVHVINGEVEWYASGTEKKLMTEGQALRRVSGGTEQALAASPSAFIGMEELNDRLSEGRRSRHQDWLKYSRQMSRDPRLIIHYRMEPSEASSRRLINHAASRTADHRISGAIVAAAQTTDRFGEEGAALDFNPTGSRVRLNVPGEHHSLTFFCWVKINSLDRWYNSLFLTDGHDSGEPHWQIMNDGRLFFSVKKRDGIKGHPDKHIFYSPPIWSPTLSGQWVMIATVYDVQEKTVTHFLNGDPISAEAIPEEYLEDRVSIGAASIGNWSEPAYSKGPDFAVRNLNGSMDEFGLFSSALSPQEIADIYAKGKP